MKKKFYLIIFLIVVLDQLTKFLFMNKKLDFGLFSINYTTNTGAAFGILKDMNLVFILIGLIVLFFVFKYYKSYKDLWLGLGFLSGGIIGNLIDRVFFGFVRDFIDLKVWPIFNIADSFSVIGVVLILWMLRKS